MLRSYATLLYFKYIRLSPFSKIIRKLKVPKAKNDFIFFRTGKNRMTSSLLGKRKSPSSRLSESPIPRKRSLSELPKAQNVWEEKLGGNRVRLASFGGKVGVHVGDACELLQFKVTPCKVFFSSKDRLRKGVSSEDFFKCVGFSSEKECFVMQYSYFFTQKGLRFLCERIAKKAASKKRAGYVEHVKEACAKLLDLVRLSEAFKLFEADFPAALPCIHEEEEK